jgi:exodeoxyribonuclease VII large subunit
LHRVGYDVGMPAVTENTERDIYTPSRLNREARTLLERALPALWLTGEISNLSRPGSGHWYFSLKDEGAQLRCAMFRQRNLLTQFKPADGMHVLARGRVSLYEPRGDYQFIVDYLEEAGEGALRRRFELLKAKLAAAGLFATERKRPLPRVPKRIGVITSPTGAALRDILNILRRRFPFAAVRIYPVPVQGAQAPEQIAAAIALASARADCDVLILSRGGGSLEDLWAFNEEIVARALFECRVPTITGIGHETDFTIADFVADMRAPTPSGAAELAVPDTHDWLRRYVLAEQQLIGVLRRRMTGLREHADWLQRRLGQLHPGIALRQQLQRADELEQRLQRAVRQHLARLSHGLTEQTARLHRRSPALQLMAARAQFNQAQLTLTAMIRAKMEAMRSRHEVAARTLHAVSPLATLTRGYAIVTDVHGAVVTDARRVTVGAQIEARFKRGRIAARVESRQIEDP